MAENIKPNLVPTKILGFSKHLTFRLIVFILRLVATVWVYPGIQRVATNPNIKICQYNDNSSREDGIRTNSLNFI